MKTKDVAERITHWLKTYCENAEMAGYVVGVSGGIDSAVVSALCAKTGLPLVGVSMPINQAADQVRRADEHLKWLRDRSEYFTSLTIDLTDAFKSLEGVLPREDRHHGLSIANTKARLRMTTLYALANTRGALVAGTGNKVEDFGIMYFTKYGDGGVDLSPIGSLTKTQVFELGKYLKVPTSILKAKPTDGLWADNRSDEDAIGATYPELERAMEICEELQIESQERLTDLWERRLLPAKYSKAVMRIYIARHVAGMHKMAMPPICEIPKEILK